MAVFKGKMAFPPSPTPPQIPSNPASSLPEPMQFPTVEAENPKKTLQIPFNPPYIPFNPPIYAEYHAKRYIRTCHT